MRAGIVLNSAILLAVILFSCTKEHASNGIPLDVVDLDTVTFEPSMKGWELYSWPNGNDWNFALVAGTNRLKSYNEVVNSPFRVTGTESLKAMLLKLPQKETVIWIEEGWLKSIWIESYYDLQLPDITTVVNIKEFSNRSGIDLIISNE